MTPVATLPAPGSSYLARLPFYYGWVNVGMAAIAMSATLPGRTYGLGLIKEPLRADLGISDLRFNVLNFWAIILGATVCMPVGRLIDRWGSRVVLCLVIGALGLSVIAMSHVLTETQLFISLTCVRGLGQGALSVVAIALVGKWFKRRAGPAMGVFTVLLGIGFVGPILVLGRAVETSGWRSGWESVGYVLLIGLLPLSWLIARSTPEAYGVPPDDSTDISPSPSAMTLANAVKTSAFWTFTLAATFFNFVFSALLLDNAILLEERRLDAAELNDAILGVLMISGLPANFIAGWMVRHRPMGKVLAVGVLMLAASLLLFPLIHGVGMALAYAALLGISGGVITVVYFAVYGHTYGRTHLGSIQSFVQVITVFSSASGPVVLAASRKYHGSSEPFFYAAAIVAILLAAASWWARPVARNAGETSG